ncbi:heat shock protein Hsp70 family protein [Cavenderia fasciculata]|uniref:Heat shock protein Hsp70 family protein n=1 Tax=Cavenderia fasciculata TaxID=261658 RepID=F4PRF3_CACFS|nr:heat shock protein Hsp70 family protein [Cavenderia fasciculata]EGG20505.1 heat shock protein Hsp70 family protein [Cavenderia fasciculata]|eukprot:XP_004358355.1 heat shock protein Hsp70 family protein [Cavenderia fasciculata]
MFAAGFDLGTKNCTIAVAQKGGVDVIANEVSNRLTPTLVSFGEKERYLGEPAATNQLRNIRNTITNLKRFIGTDFKNSEGELVQESFSSFELPNGQVGFNVNYLNEPLEISADATVGALLGKLKRTTEAFSNTPMREVVISVPGYWTEYQRRALLNAGAIAGLNITRLMNETTATALSYGIYKDLPETDPIRVLFIDIGDASTSVAAVAFKKGELKVLSTAYEPNVGGRNFDNTLVKHFQQEWKQKYKIDIFENKKALIRTRQACERLKKMISSNNEAPISIDSLMEDKDVKGTLDRKTFEELCAADLESILAPVKKAIEASGITADQFTTIEITGGGTRSTSVQKKLIEFLGRDLSKTINPEESVCRGCSLQCAMLSPLFKVRQFAINDIASYPISVLFKSASIQQNLALFNLTSPVPSPKPLRISFPISKAEPFEIVVSTTYGTLQSLTVQNVPAFTNKSSIKAKVWLDIHGVFHIDEVRLVEQLPEDQQPEQSPKDSDQKMGEAVEGEKKEGEEKKECEVKKPSPVKVKETPLQFQFAPVHGLSPADLLKATEEEGRMHAQDVLAAETADRKNALESYIYEMRSRLSSSLAEYATKEESTKLLALLQEAEDWLYGDGEDTLKSVYVAKLEELTKIGNPIAKRRQDNEEYPEAVRSLKDTIAHYREQAMTPQEKYDHIPAEEKEKIITECNNTEQWIDALVKKQEATPKTSACLINIAEVNAKKQLIAATSNAILNKPKPKPVPVATPTTPTTENTEAPASSAETQTPPQPESEKPKSADMDLD